MPGGGDGGRASTPGHAAGAQGTSPGRDGGAEGRVRELAFHLHHSRVDSRWSAGGAPWISSLQALRPLTTRHSPRSSTASTVLRPFPAADSSEARPCTPGSVVPCRPFYPSGFEVLFQAATTQRITLQAAAAALSLPSPSPGLAPGTLPVAPAAPRGAHISSWCVPAAPGPALHSGGRCSQHCNQVRPTPPHRPPVSQ